jgi:NADPH2:quinone reductase
VRELSGYLTSGRLKVLVGARFPLTQTAEAHRQMEARQTTGKVVLIVRE